MGNTFARHPGTQPPVTHVPGVRPGRTIRGMSAAIGEGVPASEHRTRCKVVVQ